MDGTAEQDRGSGGAPETSSGRRQQPRGRRLRSGVVAAGAAFGLTLAGLGLADAQTDDSTSPPPAAGGEAARPDEGVVDRHHHMRFGGHGKGMGMGIHGEFTTRAPGGGYQTLASQLGEVTEVSASSITVRSEDGFTRTYRVDDNTLVNAGNDGIADVRHGDRVAVVAVVNDGQAGAVDIQDVTRVRESRERWAPRPSARRAPGTGQGTTS